MRSLPLRDIRLTDPFWSRWQKAVRETTLAAEWKQLKETGRISNFLRAAGKEEGPHEGLFFNDSDVYKWIEACSFSLATVRDPKIEAMVDEAIGIIEDAQEPDGYLDTFFQLKHPDLKWRNLHTMHEMYCAGHLIEAAVAHFEATGSRRLLDVALKNVALIMSIFGPGKKRGYCGHEEIELALVKLAKTTGEDQYREYARWMVEERGHRPSPFEAELEDEASLAISPWASGMLKPKGVYNGEYFQDHAPIREHTEIVGHAVRAMYFYIAATELADGLGDVALEEALFRIWGNLTGRRMYVTGGIGPAARNEGFTNDFDLPNLSAYAETCAAIGLIFWGHRFLEQTGISEYADVVERALYNGALSGISLSGDHFFYTNPLESRGEHERTPWFLCACCPPNIARLIASLGLYVVGVSSSDLYVHMPVGFEADCVLGEVKCSLTLTSNYPWSGSYALRVGVEREARFAIHLRIPEWCEDCAIEIDGTDDAAEYADGYAVFDRVWKPGETISVEMTMQPKWVQASPAVLDDLGRVALTCGPLVYCAEGVDTGFEPQRFIADVEAELEAVFDGELLEGVSVVEVPGVIERAEFSDQLYADLGTVEYEDASSKFIPYYAWCNRGPGSMQVWVRQ